MLLFDVLLEVSVKTWMNSHYHSANLVIVLPFRQLLAPLAPQDDATNGVLEPPFKRRRLADDPNSPC